MSNNWNPKNKYREDQYNLGKLRLHKEDIKYNGQG